MAYANPRIPRARRKHVRSLIDALQVELGGKFTSWQRELAQRAAFISLLIEDHEARVLAGEQVDPLPLMGLGNAQRRLLAMLGLRREPPPAPTPFTAFEDSLVANYKALASKSGKEAA